MPSKPTEIRNFQGLFLQQNSFDVPDGAMEKAMDIIIQSDGVISKTKGFYTYYQPGSIEDIRGLMEFDGKLLAAFYTEIASFSDDLSIDANSPVGLRTDLTGDPVLCSEQVRSEKQNQNLYFNTDYGVYKLESTSGKVRRSGVPPALDLYVTVGTVATGPLPADSQSAWRVVFGRRDENGNLLLGAPGDIATLGIPVDGTGLAYTSSGAGPYTVTVTLPGGNAGYATGQQIIVTGGSDPDVNGTQTITIPALSTNTFQFSVAGNPGASGTLNISFSRDATLRATIPAEIDDTTDGWFARFYRSSASAALTVSPSPDFALVGEVILTSSDINNRVVVFSDDVDPVFVGAQLYTNPNSREGEVQANARPPRCKDLTLFGSYMFYANVETRQFISLQLLDPVLPNVPYEFKIKLGGVTEIFYGNSSGVQNERVPATSVSGTGTITITYASHGASNGWTVYVADVTGTVPRGTYTVSGITTNTFQITSTGNTATALHFEFVTNGTGGVFKMVTNLSSTAQMITETAGYLVKAINRASDICYANYVSTFDDAPGKIRITTQGFDTFFDLAVADDGLASPFFQYWSPPLPNSFVSGVQLYAENSTLTDTLFFSKADEPEAVPVVNFIRVGSKSKAILRIFALRDSLVIIKEDGVFVLTGSTIQDFNVTPLDPTVLFTSDRTAAKINNTVMALSSNQGLVQITEKSVQIISRRIDDIIQPMLGFDGILGQSLAFGHESGRTFYLSINDTMLDRPAQTYLYSVVNQTYTETSETFRQMLTGPGDVLYGTTIAEYNAIKRQRKSQTLVDYAREFMTATALATTLRTVTLTLTGGGTAFSPVAGDVVVYNDVINRIASWVSVGGSVYTVTFVSDTNIPTSGSPVACVVYQGYLSTVKMAPFHAGQVGLSKQFSAMQLHLRQNSISELNVSWGGVYYGSSEEVDWTASLSSGSGASGWGNTPWGLFPWGLADSIRLIPGTASGSIIRTWVDKFAQRSTFIQTIMNHRQACEQILIQALDFEVRGYGNRTSR